MVFMGFIHCCIPDIRSDAGWLLAFSAWRRDRGRGRGRGSAPNATCYLALLPWLFHSWLFLQHILNCIKGLVKVHNGAIDVVRLLLHAAVWCLGIRCLCLGIGIRCLGIRFFGIGIRCLCLGIRCLGIGIRCWVRWVTCNACRMTHSARKRGRGRGSGQRVRIRNCDENSTKCRGRAYLSKNEVEVEEVQEQDIGKLWRKGDKM